METFIKPKQFVLKSFVDRKAGFPETIIAIGKGTTEVSGEFEDNWSWYINEQNTHFPCVFIDNLYTEKKD